VSQYLLLLMGKLSVGGETFQPFRDAPRAHQSRFRSLSLWHPINTVEARSRRANAFLDAWCCFKTGWGEEDRSRIGGCKALRLEPSIEETRIDTLRQRRTVHRQAIIRLSATLRLTLIMPILFGSAHSLLIETHASPGIAGSHARGKRGRQICRISSQLANLSTTLAPVARLTIYRPRVPNRSN